MKIFMKDKYDDKSAIIHIHSGTGGKDASNCAKMLERLYIKWAQNQKYKIEILDRQEDIRGIKYSTFSFEGNYAFGKMNCEKGIHRLHKNIFSSEILAGCCCSQETNV